MRAGIEYGGIVCVLCGRVCVIMWVFGGEGREVETGREAADAVDIHTVGQVSHLRDIT